MKLVLSAVTAANISKYVKKDGESHNAMKLAIDGLYSDGIKPENMFSPGKDQDRTFYASLENAVVAGFTASIQNLLKKDVKTLNQDKKDERRRWQQQIGSRIKDMRNSLKRRIDKANAEESGEAQNSTASWESVKRKALTDIITQAKKRESTTIKDLPKFIQDLESALARIPFKA